MKVTVFLFEGVTPLDAIGPADALARLPEITVEFCASKPGIVRSQDGFVGLQAGFSFDAVSNTDILLIPGGSKEGLGKVIADKGALQWIARMHERTTYTTSVCTGSVILSAAGVTKGQAVSTHWRAKEFLPRLGAAYSTERVTRNGKVLTAAGVTAGIELGLVLCGLVAGPEVGAAVQLSMEYAPAPPFKVQTAVEAPPDLLELVSSRLRA